MAKKLTLFSSFLLFVFLMVLLSACNQNEGPDLSNIEPTPTRQVVLVAAAPTATNFPRLGTPTPLPPTVEPTPTHTPEARNTIFDDETLEDLMAGTIASGGIDATVDIVDERANGGERTANITIVTEHNIEGSDLLLKIFILEVGNALRSVRAFSQGTLNADLDRMFLTVVDRNDTVVGTVGAPMSEIITFLDGQSSVDEALERLDITGVFEDFKRN